MTPFTADTSCTATKNTAEYRPEKFIRLWSLHKLEEVKPYSESLSDSTLLALITLLWKEHAVSATVGEVVRQGTHDLHQLLEAGSKVGT